MSIREKYCMQVYTWRGITLVQLQSAIHDAQNIDAVKYY